MNILVTGAKGFVGKNLCAALKNIRDGKDRTRNIKIEEIFEYDIDTEKALLDGFCEKADFVFNLAGVNRPKETAEFMQGNFGFASELLNTLKKHNNKCPVMLSSSIQATLIGRYDSDYGRSKKAGEDLFFKYSKGACVPFSESLWQMVQAELQQRRCNLLQQYRERFTHNRKRPQYRA